MSIANESTEKFSRLANIKTLSELRKSLGKTQGEVGKAARLSQSEVSAFEGRTAHNLKALRRYIKALGGTIEVIAVFDKGERIIHLKNV